MHAFLLIVICLGLGIFFRARKIFPENGALALNRFVIYVSLPAVTLKALHQITFTTASLPAIAMSWFMFAAGLIFFPLVARLWKLPRKTLGALLLTGTLGNTSFVGFPILEAFFGASALSLGILIDQPGTFLVAGTLGIFVASTFASQRPSLKVILRKIFTFPPFLAVLLALVLRPISYPPVLSTLLDRLGITLVPLALVAVGLQLKLDRSSLKRELRPLVLGLGFKLLIGPLVMLVLYAGLFRLQGSDLQIILVESAMAPMITAGIIATEYGLGTELSSLMIGIGIPLSLVTIPIWNWLLTQWFG